MSAFAGSQLMKSNGSKEDATTIVNKADVILVYFSAHWCPPCRQFTPKLKSFYEGLHQAKGEKLCIIFVSSDRTAEDMMSYFKNDHGDYYAVDSNDTDLVKKLKGNCDVSGIPMLCVVNKNGDCKYSGRSDVENKTADKAYDLFVTKSN